MGGVAGGEGAMGKTPSSQQGICGVLMQNKLPAARVLYASATGASDVNNLAYAVRLGMWGPETAFATREAFIIEIRKGGIAAMELVARDLKALGLYTSRGLSFAGVEYDILRHALTPAQIGVYDTYFPTRQMQIYTDDTGTARSAPMSDEDGNPVHNPEAIASRDAMIENIWPFRVRAAHRPALHPPRHR